ncbi:MAG: hypothetical protein WC551_06370 [Patescibacteria group bacterium]
MKKIQLSNTHILYLVAVLAVIATAVALRFMMVAKPERIAVSPTPISTTQPSPATTVPAGLPLPTSAKFAEGDALKALGPNWTFLKQQDQKMMSMSFIDGTAPNRESVVQLINDPKVSLDLQESSIASQDMLDSALADKDVKKTKVAGREGYIVPMGSLGGGTGLVLTGSSTILIIQDANTEVWPDNLDPEVAAYIAAVRVP